MINRFSGLVLGPVLALAVAGCQETTQTAARPRVDAPGVPVSVQSISGAPENVTTSFAGLLGEAAAERKMEIVPGNKPARFRVRAISPPSRPRTARPRSPSSGTSTI
jgi:hypothetical protein